MYLWEQENSGSFYSTNLATSCLFGKLLVHFFLYNQPSSLHISLWAYAELLLYIYLKVQFLIHKIQIPSPWASQVALLVKYPPTNAGDPRDVGSIPGSGRSPGGGHGNPLQYSCLENPMDRGAWWATVHGVAESDTTEVTQHTCTHLYLCCWWSGLQSDYPNEWPVECTSWSIFPISLSAIL